MSDTRSDSTTEEKGKGQPAVAPEPTILFGPLQWPESIPRTVYRVRGNFHLKSVKSELGIDERAKKTFTKVVTDMHCNSAIVTWRPKKIEDITDPELLDPGVAVYFEKNKIYRVIACDRYQTILANFRAIIERAQCLNKLLTKQKVDEIHQMIDLYTQSSEVVIPKVKPIIASSPQVVAEKESQPVIQESEPEHETVKDQQPELVADPVSPITENQPEEQETSEHEVIEVQEPYSDTTAMVLTFKPTFLKSKDGHHPEKDWAKVLEIDPSDLTEFQHGYETVILPKDFEIVRKAHRRLIYSYHLDRNNVKDELSAKIVNASYVYIKKFFELCHETERKYQEELNSIGTESPVKKTAEKKEEKAELTEDEKYNEWLACLKLESEKNNGDIEYSRKEARKEAKELIDQSQSIETETDTPDDESEEEETNLADLDFDTRPSVVYDHESDDDSDDEQESDYSDDDNEDIVENTDEYADGEEEMSMSDYDEF